MASGMSLMKIMKNVGPRIELEGDTCMDAKRTRRMAVQDNFRLLIR